VAGDPERLAMKKVEEDGGILYHPNFITYLVRINISLRICSIFWVNTPNYLNETISLMEI